MTLSKKRRVFFSSFGIPGKQGLYASVLEKVDVTVIHEETPVYRIVKSHCCVH